MSLDFFGEGLSVIKGLPGSGKTTLAATVACNYGRIVWFTFYEERERLRAKLKQLGLCEPTYIYDLPSLGDGIIADYLVEKIADKRPDIVVVDGVNALNVEDERRFSHLVLHKGLASVTPLLTIKEGLDTSPIDYIADNLVELRYKFVRGFSLVREMRIVKTRGYPTHMHLVYFDIVEGRGIVFFTPRGTPLGIRGDRITTGAPEVDDVLGGGVEVGSIVAVAGPPTGIASKLLVLTAIAVAEKGYKVLYHHHYKFPTFMVFAEQLGARVDNPNITWLFHPVEEHMSVGWWYKSASLVTDGNYTLHVADNYEIVVPLVGRQMIYRAVSLYRDLVGDRAVTVPVFNSIRIWNRLAENLGGLVDYIFIFTNRHLVIRKTPNFLGPLKLRYSVRGRRVVFERI